MTLLVISPDYASHLLPLATLATAWRDAGERVVVATGPATAGIVAEFGFERADLALGRGSNPGVIRAEQQPPGEDDALRGFFDATRHGMVATLRYQAEARRTDLLWEPVDRARAVLDVVDRCARPDHRRPPGLQRPPRPRRGGRPARRRRARPPVGAAGRRRGLRLPARLAGRLHPAGVRARRPAPAVPRGPRRLHRGVERRPARAGARAPRRRRTRSPSTATCCCSTTRRRCTTRPARRCCRRTRSSARPCATSRRTTRSGPGSPPTTGRWSTSASAASCRRAGTCWPRCWTALRPLGLRVAVATGSATGLPAVPPDWLVRPYLPQVALLDRAALLVTHGGNNSVTEALTAGVPMLVLPFSTDQFAGRGGDRGRRGGGRARPERGHARGAGRRRARRPRRPGPAAARASASSCAAPRAATSPARRCSAEAVTAARPSGPARPGCGIGCARARRCGW